MKEIALMEWVRSAEAHRPASIVFANHRDRSPDANPFAAIRIGVAEASSLTRDLATGVPGAKPEGEPVATRAPGHRPRSRRTAETGSGIRAAVAAAGLGPEAIDDDCCDHRCSHRAHSRIRLVAWFARSFPAPAGRDRRRGLARCVVRSWMRGGRRRFGRQWRRRRWRMGNRSSPAESLAGHRSRVVAGV